VDTELAQQEFIGALEAIGGSAGNGRLRELLGWSEAIYESVRATLIARGQVTPGRGRGGSVALAGPGAPPEASSHRSASQLPPPVTISSTAPGPQPTGKQNLSAFIWSVADLLRGDYKQSDYGKVILPFTVLRRLDCVLEPTKAAVSWRRRRCGRARASTRCRSCCARPARTSATPHRST
jgi:type I restriction enzyme M protein